MRQIFAAAIVAIFALLTLTASPDASTRDRDSKNNGAFRGALLGASFALLGSLLAGMLTNLWSNYLARHDQHVQEAERCIGLVSSLLTTSSLARDVTQSAASSVAAPIPANRVSNKFALPPLDEIIHSQDQSLDILDPTSRDWILRLEAYYRAIRDDLSNTPGIYHTGETFGVPPSSGEQDTYEKLLNAIAQQAEGAMESKNE